MYCMEKRAVQVVAVIVFFAACVCNGETRIEDTALYKYLIVPQAKIFQVTPPVQEVKEDEAVIEQPKSQLKEEVAKDPEPDREPPRKRRKQIVSSPLMTADTPFYEAIDILRNSTKRPLNIFVNWTDLEENAGVDRDTPIGIGGIERASVRQYLRLILHSLSVTSKAKIGFVVEGGVIHIATEDSLPRRMSTRVYNVPGLLMAPSNPMPFGGQGYGMPYGGGMGQMGPMGSYGNYGGGYGGYGGGYGGSPRGGYGGGYGGSPRGGYRGSYGGPVMHRNYSAGYIGIPTGVGLRANGGFFGNVGYTQIPVGYNSGRGVVRTW